MDGFGLLAGLLGGYQQGRQLRQSRDIRKAQIDRQVVQDAYTRAHQQKMEDYAARRLKIAENPVRNVDPAAGLNFDRTKGAIDAYWKSWRERMKENGATLQERSRIFQEGLDALHGHRQQLQGAINQWGPQVGFEGADPDMFLAPLHGIRGLSYDKATGRYTYGMTPGKDGKVAYDPSIYEGQYGITQIQQPDSDRIKAKKDYLASTHLPVDEQRAAMQVEYDYIRDKYGKTAADIHVGTLPGDEVQIGTRQQFVPDSKGYQPYTPNQGFALPDNVNPALGIQTPDGMVRRSIDPNMLAGEFGGRQPGPFADEATKNAFYERNLQSPAQWGRSSIGHTASPFDALPKQLRPYDLSLTPNVDFKAPVYKNTDEEWRRGYMERVMNPNRADPNSEEEIGMSMLIQNFKRNKPDFDPFMNPDDARTMLAVATPDIAQTYNRILGRVAQKGGFEKAGGETKAVPVTRTYQIAPKTSTLTSEANAKLAGERATSEGVMREPKRALTVAQTEDYTNRQNERLWRRGFDQLKAEDSSDRGWANVGVARGRLNLSQSKAQFDQKIKAHQVEVSDLKTIQGMWKHSDLEIKTKSTQLRAVMGQLANAKQQYALNGNVLETNNVPSHIIRGIQDGTLKPGSEYDRWIKGADMINAANMLSQIGQYEKQIDDLNADINIAGADQEQAKKWEASARDHMTGDAKRRTDIYDAWKKKNPSMSDEVAWGKAELGLMPDGTKPKSSGKAKPKSSTGGPRPIL